MLLRALYDFSSSFSVFVLPFLVPWRMVQWWIADNPSRWHDHTLHEHIYFQRRTAHARELMFLFRQCRPANR